LAFSRISFQGPWALPDLYAPQADWCALGAFYVSGSLSMPPGIPPGIQEAMDLGISIFAGEAEGRLGELLQFAQRGSLKPIYTKGR
jgi:hypothetical protein